MATADESIVDKGTVTQKVEDNEVELGGQEKQGQEADTVQDENNMKMLRQRRSPSGPLLKKIKFQDHLEKFLNELHQGIPETYHEVGKKIWSNLAKRYGIDGERRRIHFNVEKYRFLEGLLDKSKNIPPWIKYDTMLLQKYYDVRKMIGEAEVRRRQLEVAEEAFESEDLEVEDEEEPEKEESEEDSEEDDIFSQNGEENDERKEQDITQRTGSSQLGVLKRLVDELGGAGTSTEEKQGTPSCRKRPNVGTEAWGDGQPPPKEMKRTSEEKTDSFSSTASSTVSLFSSVSASVREEQTRSSDSRDFHRKFCARIEDQERIKKLEAKVAHLEEEKQKQAACAFTLVFEYRTKWDKLAETLRKNDLAKVKKDFPEIFNERT